MGFLVKVTDSPHEKESAQIKALLDNPVCELDSRTRVLIELSATSQRVDELEAELKNEKAKCRWMAGELAKASYSFTAQDWLDVAERETRNE